MFNEISVDEFREKIFDFETSEEWKFKGDKMVVIDFYSEWCQPCKMLKMIIAKLVEDYIDDVVFYKVDVEKSVEISNYCEVQSVPSLLFLTPDGCKEMKVGLFREPELREIIDLKLEK